MSPGRLRALGWIALAVAAIAVPFFFGSFRVGQFTQVLCYAVAILGLNVLVGFSGQISLGHGAFFGLGAYAGAVLITDANFPHLLTVPVAGLLGLVAGYLFGLPALRVRGLYLALLTLGLAVAFPPVIKRLEGLTGGAQGINVAQPEPVGGLASDQWIYFLTLAVVAPLFLFVANLMRSRVGRALITVRDAELAGKTMGVDLARYKTAAFAVSAAYAAIGGALYVFTVGFVSPESFTLTQSISFLAAVVVGGLATVSGAIFGALFIVLVPEYAADVDEALAGVIYGAVLIAFMFVERNGIVGLGRRIWRLRQRRGGKQTQEDPAPPAAEPNRGVRTAGS